MAESAFGSGGFVECVDKNPCHLSHGLNDQLGDAVSILYDAVLGRKVNQENLNFSAVIGVDGAGCIQTSNPLFERKAAAGRTCASYPMGSSMKSPVGTNTRCRGAKVIGSGRKARRSNPEDPSVAYAGKGCEDRLTIETGRADMPQR